MTPKRQPTPDEARERARHLLDDPEGPEKVLGSRVRALREQWGYSQEQLARVMRDVGFKWQQTTVAKTEAGKRPVRVNEATAIARHFGVTLDDLLSLALLGPEDGQSVQAFRLAVSLAAASRMRLDDLAARRAALDAELSEVGLQAAAAVTLLDMNGADLTEAIKRLLPSVEDADNEGGEE